jgi:hypothetical protein
VRTALGCDNLGQIAATAITYIEKSKLQIAISANHALLAFALR